MQNRNFNKFFSSIVVPSILAIALFVISFFAIILPQFESSMMDRKKEMIRELTNTAISIIEEHQRSYKLGLASLEQSQLSAAKQIEQMRYGSESKDYFWIIDHTPTMIMHPYRKDLNGTNLRNYKDSHEKKLFVDAANVVKKQGEGFINYYWQWKDDTTRVVPKLSYVKGYTDWQWIIGTGIYLDDVEEELSQLKSRLLYISALIVGIIILTLIYVIRQSHNIENKRKATEKKLISSKQKYKTLVDASTEGTLMFIDGIVTFNNFRFIEMIGSETGQLSGRHFNDIFDLKWEEVLALFSDPRKSVTVETKLKCENQLMKDVVISASHIQYSNHDAYILTTKDVSKPKQLEKSAQKLSEELQNSLLLMNRPIKSFVKKFISCKQSTTIYEASILMKESKQKIIFIKDDVDIIGAVNDRDLINRVLATNVNNDESIKEVMSSPVKSISENALLYEAIILFKRYRVSHLLVLDAMQNKIGVIGNQDALELQRNSLSYLVKEIQISTHIEELKLIYHGVPPLVSAILAGSDNARHTSRIITSIADAITYRVISLAIEEIGPAPCPFAFMVMGSAGRMEQTLKTDQDNGIVLSNTVSKQDLIYFSSLAKTINQNLDEIGYNLCKGDVMAQNEKWCQTLGNWKKQFTLWTKSPDPQNILDSSIFYDFRFIYGDQTLIDDLKTHVNEEVKNNGLFFYHMANSIINWKTASNNEELNIKKILLPLVGYLRLESLKNQITQTNTVERIEMLWKRNVISEDRKNELIEIYNFLMHIRLNHQASALIKNDLPENTVKINDISGMEFSNFKKIINEIDQIQRQLGIEGNRMM